MVFTGIHIGSMRALDMWSLSQGQPQTDDKAHHLFVWLE